MLPPDVVWPCSRVYMLKPHHHDRLIPGDCLYIASFHLPIPCHMGFTQNGLSTIKKCQCMRFPLLMQYRAIIIPLLGGMARILRPHRCRCGSWCALARGVYDWRGGVLWLYCRFLEEDVPRGELLHRTHHGK